MQTGHCFALKKPFYHGFNSSKSFCGVNKKDRLWTDYAETILKYTGILRECGYAKGVTTSVVLQPCPTQQNFCDCGVMALACAEELLRVRQLFVGPDTAWGYSQQHTAFYRRWIHQTLSMTMKKAPKDDEDDMDDITALEGSETDVEQRLSKRKKQKMLVR
ncbi:hypothetical protein niasHS_015604 [Heterodera schachtii]|uniref:Ubiquitin-like protease family profile domain-containing protein n=1 Tax=Heterodera schachtii TaxID=97005 RepID=A0ABD2HZS4_HETSC